MGSWDKNVVGVRSVQVKSCCGIADNSMFRLFQTSLFSNYLFLRKHLYYQLLVHFRVVGNHVLRVKYLHQVHVNMDCRTLNLGTRNLLGLQKGKFKQFKKI